MYVCLRLYGDHGIPWLMYSLQMSIDLLEMSESIDLLLCLITPTEITASQGSCIVGLFTSDYTNTSTYSLANKYVNKDWYIQYTREKRNVFVV